MEAPVNNSLQQFKNLVGTKFQLYNSLFTSLPFHRVEKTGIFLSLFLLHCEEGYAKGGSPQEITDAFFEQYTTIRDEQQRTDLLFRFVQYAERQVVLFDALEDAAFRHIRDLQGTGTLRHLQSEVVQEQVQDKLKQKLEDFSVRLVLTAHPTQFYPGEVLGIINDLSKALIEDNTAEVNMYLQQLGKTPFFKKEKPTPYDEAISLVWFLENIFYQAAGRILSFIRAQFPGAIGSDNAVIRMGFWPGGDRDGNPFVTAPTTIAVAAALRSAVMKCYFREVRNLRRRLTFKGVANEVAGLEAKLSRNLFVPGHTADISRQEILDTLSAIRNTIITEHNGLFVHLVDNLISKVEVFGLFFASLDIRQDSSIHAAVLENVAAKTNALPKDYASLNDEAKIEALLQIKAAIDPALLENPLHEDTLQTVSAIRQIQAENGEEGCSRYIISHSTSVLNVLEVYGIFLLGGWKKEDISVDIVPLFETIDDLRHAGRVMEALYRHPEYHAHLRRRQFKQTIMLGFSDGTKDGGYLMANWSIYKAKEELTAISKKYDIKVVFFDGRGGPPARGGGKTHQFYASMGRNIANKEIQQTIQGQTISSNFGTVDAAQFNMEQLIHAGISNELFSSREVTLSAEEENLLESLADAGYQAYNKLKNHPYFLAYLDHASPLRYYAEANIGSRPSKRNASAKLNLNDLRAVPYVGAWSQLKQNVPGYYGVGSALQQLETQGKWSALQHLYQHSLFFRTLLDNCEMAMKKSYFPLTAYLAKHPQYGEVWQMIYAEFELTRKYLLRLSGESELMAASPIDQLSIQMRERIVLPLLTVQQYALTKIRELDAQPGNGHGRETYEKLIMRCSFGIINAGRNSA
ncbi:phosphoenolpyruvate carboxylase [Chitinophaga nivalis]|uniref:Phosphoenolpyruvate carboxylase n=1 Tax=Chitinophaga nivalis TaxID=2991709 RepID=A0ABT3IEC9_9BACT|nr:phosphoenolpyruvate carboxylase [Chitinophaga nivalis]MCW3467997.1 phosphoenolpyruvate carboxylase [Chitinophaga nivalis]MCW3482312.1 phosphoenolpyruvate carboxylase [Chitinophaga nivalis]